MPRRSEQPRSRHGKGCYTCRFRKVKCVDEDPSLVPQDRDLRDCLSCQRLGFQCQRNAPAPGESFQPPPKRRKSVRLSGRGSTSNSQRGSIAIDDGIPMAAVADERKSPGQRLPDSAPTSGLVVQHTTSQAPIASIESSARNIDSTGFISEAEMSDLGLLGESWDFPMLDLSKFVNLDHIADAGDDQILSLGGQSDPQPSTTDEDQGWSALVSEDKDFFVQHYLNVMKDYSKLTETSAENTNLFVSIFSRSLVFPPLFYAILSFSAAHLSIQDPSYQRQAVEFDDHAYRSFAAFRQKEEVQVEGLLSALFIRIKKTHIMGESAETFLSIMDDARAILCSSHGQEALKNPSPLIQRLILRFAILDSRAACFRLGGGAFVETFRHTGFLSKHLDSASSPGMASQSAVVSLLRANMLRMKVGQLDEKLHLQLQSDFISSPPVKVSEVTSLYSSIQSEIRPWEQELTAHQSRQALHWLASKHPLDPAVYGCCTILSVLYNAILYLQRIFPLPGFDAGPSVRGLLRLMQIVKHDASRKGSPSAILPAAVLLAGLSTDDSIQQEWVLDILAAGSQWGICISKTRDLLRFMLERQAEDREIDICTAMNEVTGRFVI